MVRRSIWHSGAIFWHSKSSIDLKVSSDIEVRETQFIFCHLGFKLLQEVVVLTEDEKGACAFGKHNSVVVSLRRD